MVEDSQILAQIVSERGEQISLNESIERFSQTIPIAKPRILDYARKYLSILILLMVDYNAILLGIL